MEGIWEWVRNLACYLILLTVVLQMVPSGAEKQYIRTFLGILLLLLVMKPILQFSGKNLKIRQQVVGQEIGQEYGVFRRSAKKVSRESCAYLEHACQREMEGQIRELAEVYGYTVTRCAITFFPGSSMELQQITLSVGGEEENLEKLKNQLSEVYNLPKGNINVSRQD